MGGGKGSSSGGGYVGRRFALEGGGTASRPVGGGTISSPPTGPFGSGGGAAAAAGTGMVRSASSDPTKGSVATGQKDFGYTDKMMASIAKATAVGAVKGAAFGPLATAIAAAWEGYKEKSIIDGEMSQKGRFGKPTIGARQGGYKSLLSDDDFGEGRDSTSDGGWGGWGGGIGEGKIGADDW